MAELTTIARPYAEAAFRLAQEENALPVWSEMLRFLATIVRDPKLAAALDNPRLGAAEREAMLLSVAGDRVQGLGRNFVRVLAESERLDVLMQIAQLYEDLRSDAEGVAHARIDTAFPLADEELRTLTATLERRFGRRIDASVEVDPGLIGGVRITVGDTVIDGSIRGKLEAMAVQLKA